MEPKIYLSRNLKYYKWSIEADGNNLPYLIITDKRSGTTIKIDKVYTMSLHKFIPNYLDKLRIIQTKVLREKLARTKQGYQSKIAKQKEKMQATKRQVSLFAKARKVK